MAVVRFAGMVRVLVRRLWRRAMVRRFRWLRWLWWRRGLRRVIRRLRRRVAAALAGIREATFRPLCTIDDLVAVIGRRHCRRGARVRRRRQIGSGRCCGTAENNGASEHE
jgi:hypothetical protein